MVDREKVISGLHCCSHTDGVNCIYCPYDIKDTDCTALMAMDVLDLLKEHKSEYEKGFNDAMLGKQELMYEGTDGKWHKKDW